MNVVQQMKNTKYATLSNQMLSSKIQSQYDVSNIDNFKFSVPKNKKDIYDAFDIIKGALNKANKIGIDLQTAASLRNVLVNLNTIINCITLVSYKTDKQQNIPSLDKIEFPSIEELNDMWRLLSTTLEQAQLKGIYDSLDDSGMLFDCLMIIGNMIGSLVVYIKHKDQQLRAILESRNEINKSDTEESVSSNNSITNNINVGDETLKKK